ncbi:MAG: heparinase II/III family protein [Lentisphaeria bacterium]|nr:heparinase II/III family protein [Lentisphaeria bacterium]
MLRVLLGGAWSLAAEGGGSMPPRLLFTAEEVPALRERAAAEPYATAWQGYLAQARRMAASAKPFEAPAEAAVEGGESGRASRLMGHRIGRGLSEWMECLGVTYHLTGEAAFAEKAVSLLTATARDFPVTQPWMGKGFAGGRGDQMRGLALGLDLLRERLGAAEFEAVRGTADGYLEHFLAEAENPKTWWYGVHNFNGVCGGAAGMLCLTLRDLDPSRYDALGERCTAVLSRWLDTSFDAQGAYVEGVGYSQYGLSNALFFARALRRAGGTDLFAHPRLRQVSRFYAQSLLPGEAVLDARNDSNYGRVNTECLLLATEAGDGLARWLYDLRGGPTMPWDVLLPCSTPPLSPAAAGVPSALHFEGRGLCVWRTGWERGDVMVSIEAGPYYRVTHNQGDKGHVTLYGLGHRWAVDPGYGNDRQRPLSRCHTLAHTCILVDGKGQALSGSGLGTDGRILRFEDHPTHGYALADCTAAYNANTSGQPGPGVEHALRHLFFVRPAEQAPAYVILLDDIRKDAEPHTFTWQMIAWPTMRITTRDHGFELLPRPLLGGAYVTTPAEAGGGGEVAWTAPVAEAGRYRLWARVRAAGEGTSSSDSFFVRVGEGEPVDWHMPSSREWTWGSVSRGVPATSCVFDLPAGPCRVAFATREAEAQLDCAVLLPEDHPAPGDRQPPAGLLTVPNATVTPPMLRIDEDPAPRMIVRVDGATAPHCSMDSYEPDDGRKPSSFPRLRADVTSPEPRFVSVLAPIPPGVDEPRVNVMRGAADTTLSVEWPQRRDVIVWPHGGTPHLRLGGAAQPEGPQR